MVKSKIINKFITYFCNSDKQKIKDLNYLDTVSDSKAKAFVTAFYDYIESQSRLLLSKMDKGEIEITHDFYLKKYQLSNPKLNFDYILFDERQDASATMLDIFLKQKDAYKLWTTELDVELTVMYCEGVNVRDMAKHFGRTKEAIRSRIEKLELQEKYG